jgi:flagellin
MRINTNVSSLNAWRNLSMTDGAMSKNLERLSSGYRINRAADDVAGLAISENMRAQITGLNQAVKNAQDGTSLLQTAEGSLNEVHTMLQRMRELAVQSANGTLQPEDRKQIQTEMDNLSKEVTRITNATQFNSKDLIDGSLQDGKIQSVTLQIGPNAGQTVNFSIGAMDAKSLGISRDVLTGVVDNGMKGTAGGAATMATTVGATAVTALGGLSNGSYAITVDGTAGTATVKDKFGNVLGVGAYAAAGGATNVQLATGTLTFTAVAAVAGQVTDNFSVAGATAASVTNQIVSSVTEVGAGITADNYQVKYDAGTGKVRLYDKNNAAIGVEADFKSGATVTIGDVNTARTVTIQLGATAPTASVADVLRIGSSVGEIKSDTNGIINGTAGQGVLGVNCGLTSNDYTVKFDGTNYQLFDAAGTVAIGGTAAAVGGKVTIGDATTRRTVDLAVLAPAGATVGAPYSAKITITNDNQAALSANFSGGVKIQSAQAFAGLNVSSADGAQAAIAVIDNAIGMVSYQRSQLGAIQNRLDHTINNLQVVSENLTASESRIRDVDMALEMTQFTKHQILMQSGTAMLAQANQKNQAVLSLLR